MGFTQIFLIFRISRILDFGNKKVHIILSAWMGICLFHNRKLESVLYARDKFLVRGGILLPSKAHLCVSLIENNEKREDNDDDLDFWKTNGKNHNQNFKELYDYLYIGVYIRFLLQNFKIILIP